MHQRFENEHYFPFPHVSNRPHSPETTLSKISSTCRCCCSWTFLLPFLWNALGYCFIFLLITAMNTP